jgi:two-component system OmpR family response regulator
MNNQHEVVVVQEVDVSNIDTVILLDNKNVSARHCNNVSDFAPLHACIAATAVVIVGGENPALVVRRLKDIDSSMLIIAINVGNSLDRRLAVLRAGSDACYAAPVCEHELLALLDSLEKRRPQQPVSPSTPGPSWVSILSPTLPRAGVWRLVKCGRSLASPDGQLLPLTTSERVVVARLLAQPGLALHRTEFASQTWSDQEQKIKPLPRSVDVLISRLRRKAETQGMYLPVLAVRRWGYMFMDQEPERQTRASRKAHTADDWTEPKTARAIKRATGAKAANSEKKTKAPSTGNSKSSWPPGGSDTPEDNR